MVKFTAKTRDGAQIIGFGLSRTNLEKLAKGEPIFFDLDEVKLGFWHQENGQREFLQPKNSNVLIMFGETEQDIGRVLGVEMPNLPTRAP